MALTMDDMRGDFDVNIDLDNSMVLSPEQLEDRAHMEAALRGEILPPKDPEEIPICFCGSVCIYMDSAELYHGKSYGMRWICRRFPDCKGSVGAHPDGRPLGTVPSETTKLLRGQLHSLIDAVWSHEKTGRERHKKRGSAYRWLSEVTGWPTEVCHIGMMDEDQCRYALSRVKAIPYNKRKELLPRRYDHAKEINDN